MGYICNQQIISYKKLYSLNFFSPILCYTTLSWSLWPVMELIIFVVQFKPLGSVLEYLIVMFVVNWGAYTCNRYRHRCMSALNALSPAVIWTVSSLASRLDAGVPPWLACISTAVLLPALDNCVGGARELGGVAKVGSTDESHHFLPYHKCDQTRGRASRPRTHSSIPPRWIWHCQDHSYTGK